MKFNRVNDNKLQIIISRDDLVERDLKKWDLVPYNPNSQRIFQEILEEAYEACGFEVGQNAQLMIEAYPMTGESMIITVTKVGNAANKGILDFDLEALEEVFADSRIEEEVFMQNPEKVCLCYNLEDAIQLAKTIMDGYLGESSLYQYKEKYYLVLQDAEKLEKEYTGFLGEYSDVLRMSSVFLEEHGTVVMAENAVSILSGL